MRRLLPLAGMLLALASAPAEAAAPDFAGMLVQPYDPPKPAPPFALPDLEGKTGRLEDLRGRVAWLYFWTTW